MNVTMAYLGRSRLYGENGSRVVQLQPNLLREPVAFGAPLAEPLRFREAMSALHDVVISDLRFKPRDKSAYLAWKEQEKRRLAQVRQAEYQRVVRQAGQARQALLTPDLQRQHDRCLKRYWQARKAYDRHLRNTDPTLWRMVMPYDPVITVAEDVVFFECFSADESSYGCLTVERDGGFGPADRQEFGTTNVDYSWDLYRHFQGLRSYRRTRFEIDPQGFEVKTQGRGDYREEKIDIPPGWLRGFLQIQGAMGMPMRKVSLSREAVYGLLAWLKRHRARTSPRAVRFELLPGRAPRLVLEPWELAVVSHATTYTGPGGEPVRIWGRRRLLALARLLPLTESVDVYLLGTGLPSFWLVRMGEMRLTLGLSGWTTNDWTRGSALDLLAPPVEPAEAWVAAAAELLIHERAAAFDSLNSRMPCREAGTAAALNRLARAGQAIYDLAAAKYRWRQVLPFALGDLDIGPPNPELSASRDLARTGKALVQSRQELGDGSALVAGAVAGTPAELLMDGDGRIRRGKCVCGHHRAYGIRKGPCRHLLALRAVALRRAGGEDASPAAWYSRLSRWANP